MCEKQSMCLDRHFDDTKNRRNFCFIDAVLVNAFSNPTIFHKQYIMYTYKYII